jgi:hypothetical protein
MPLLPAQPITGITTPIIIPANRFLRATGACICKLPRISVRGVCIPHAFAFWIAGVFHFLILLPAPDSNLLQRTNITFSTWDVARLVTSSRVSSGVARMAGWPCLLVKQGFLWLDPIYIRCLDRNRAWNDILAGTNPGHPTGEFSHDKRDGTARLRWRA